MNVPARKSDVAPLRKSNLPSLIVTSPTEHVRVPTLDAHEFFNSSIDETDSWSLPGLLVTSLAAVVLGASTYVALLTKQAPVPAVAAPVIASAPVTVKEAKPEEDPARLATAKTLATFTKGLSDLGARFPSARLAVAQKSHKGVVMGVSESFFFTKDRTKVESSTAEFFEAVRALAEASGLHFNVAIETSAFMTDDAEETKADYVLHAKRGVAFSNELTGDIFLQRRVRTTLQTGSATAGSRVALKFIVSQTPN